MSAVQFVNSQAQVLKKAQALAMNINAGKGLYEIMKTNLGPRGTLKMLVGGAGQIKLTKDGSVLLNEMQIKHPTAAMIARAATAQDDTVGDGTTSNVLFIGELLRHAERLVCEGVHPRTIAEGYELSKNHCLKILPDFLQKKEIDSALLQQVAKTSLNSKLHPDIANQMVDIVVEAVQIIQQEDKQIDLHMVEVMHMPHKMAANTRLIRGLVLDHGGRHPDMPKELKNCYILTANISLEYEKTEVHSGFYFKNAEQREKLVQSERALTDDKCRKIIELKRKVCDGTDKTFVLINQKGIDPISLDMLAKENILGLRRAKRRNMERLVLACGGRAINSVEDIKEEDLGFAELVYQQDLGEDKYTFVEGCKNPLSCSILVKGPNDHTIAMLKDAVRDGLRAVKNTIEDGGVIPGAGAFEVYAYSNLVQYKDEVKGKLKMAVQAFADSIVCIPKVLAENSGFDSQEVLLELIDKYNQDQVPVGVNVIEKGVISPDVAGVYDNLVVKKQFLNLAPTLAQQLVLCDEILKAGKKMGGKKGPGAPAPGPGGMMMPGGMPMAG